MMELRFRQLPQAVGKRQRLLEVAKRKFPPQLQRPLLHQRLPVGNKLHQLAQLLIAHLGGIGATRFTLLAGQFGHGLLLLELMKMK